MFGVKTVLFYCASLLLAIALPSCKSAKEPSAPVAAQTSQSSAEPASTPSAGSSTAEPVASDRESFLASDYFIKDNSFSMNGYEVLKLVKKGNLSDKSDWLKFSFAAIRKNKRTIATFDGIGSEMQHGTDVGLFALLGGKTKQVIISQTVPRGGRHWIVSLSPHYRMLFDSGDYEVGREEVGLLDLDKDGIYELSIPVTAFYSAFFEMAIADTPLPDLIFKYNPVSGKYEPANHLFQSYLLKGIEERISHLANEDRNVYLSARLDILLNYLYAGEEKKGWAFFRHSYQPPTGFQLPDRQTVEAKVREVLKDCPAYKLIRQKAAAAKR